MARFDFNAKTAFLTYSQVTEAVTAASLFGYWRHKDRVIKVLVGSELHQDGGKHYHCLIEFEDKMHTRNIRYFDYEGFHPNIARPRNKKNCMKYCIKDGDYMNHGWDIDGHTEIAQMVRDAASMESREEALKAIVLRGGDKALKLWHQVDAYLGILQNPIKRYEPVKIWPIEFPMVGEHAPILEQACANFIGTILVPEGGRTDAHKSLWLYGPSRSGKTTLARSLGRHWYMNGMWNAEQLDESAEYGVMDDIPWENMKFNYKGILGWQTDITVTDKYRRKTVYAGGKGVIVCTNTKPLFSYDEMEWLNKNVVFIEITDKIY